MEGFDEPSLAVIILPSQLPSSLPDHSLYLPLINRPSFNLGTALPALSSAFSHQVVSDSAHYAWERAGLPQEKTLLLDVDHPDTVADEADLEHLDGIVLAKAFASLIRSDRKSNHYVNDEDSVFNGW